MIVLHQRKLVQSVKADPKWSVHFLMLILSSKVCLYFQWLALMDVKTCNWMFFWIVLFILNHNELLHNLLQEGTPTYRPSETLTSSEASKTCSGAKASSMIWNSKKLSTCSNILLSGYLSLNLMCIVFLIVLDLELYTLYAFESSEYPNKILLWDLTSNIFRLNLLFKI